MIMRSLTVLAVTALAIGGSSLATAGSATIAKANAPTDFMREALGNLLAQSLVVVEADDSYSFDEGSCIYAGFVAVEHSVSIVKTLDSKKSYMFVAAGDDDVTDVDIQVLRNGAIVAQDTMDDNEPYVEFSPKQSGEYTVKVVLYEASEDSFVGLCCLSDDGWSIPVSRFDSAIDNLMQRVDTVSDKYEGIFLQNQNSWCLYGGVLEEGEDWFGITNISLTNPPYIVMGAGDTAAEDLDLELFKSGRKVAEDKAEDNFPLLTIRNSGSYEVRLVNAGPASLSLFTLLDVDHL